MTGSPQTIATLQTYMANLIATLQARTGNLKINLVTDPEFGADPTNTVDSTSVRDLESCGRLLAPQCKVGVMGSGFRRDDKEKRPPDRAAVLFFNSYAAYA